jgi:hypothetical protein
LCLLCLDKIQSAHTSWSQVLQNRNSEVKYESLCDERITTIKKREKQLTKLTNLLMHSQCALSEPISSSRNTRKLRACRFI